MGVLSFCTIAVSLAASRCLPCFSGTGRRDISTRLSTMAHMFSGLRVLGVFGLRHVVRAFGFLHVLDDQRLQGGQHFVHAGVEEIGIGMAKPDPALPIQNKERTRADPLPVPIRAVQARYPTPWLEIRQQREAELCLARERRMAVDAVDRDAEQPRA